MRLQLTLYTYSSRSCIKDNLLYLKKNKNKIYLDINVRVDKDKIYSFCLYT
jgi:hypothetical protein